MDVLHPREQKPCQAIMISAIVFQWMLQTLALDVL
jgi:hypothetical protein